MNDDDSCFALRDQPHNRLQLMHDLLSDVPITLLLVKC